MISEKETRRRVNRLNSAFWWIRGLIAFVYNQPQFLEHKKTQIHFPPFMKFLMRFSHNPVSADSSASSNRHYELVLQRGSVYRLALEALGFGILNSLWDT